MKRAVIGLCTLMAIFNLLASEGKDVEQFKQDVSQAYKKIEPVIEANDHLLTEGSVTKGDQALLDFFPQSTRTAAQSFFLGSLMFEADPKLSFSLIQAAVSQRPDLSAMDWTWALEQHRAGDYSGALKAYQVYSTNAPEQAAVYALEADCLLRLGRIDEAIAAWRKFEKEPEESIKEMEKVVCMVHREPLPQQQRELLLNKVNQSGDAMAAAELIALDCDYPHDWWKIMPYMDYLDHDVTAVTNALKLPSNDPVIRAINCANDFANARGKDESIIHDILNKYQLITDQNHTLPANGALLSVIILKAIEFGILDQNTFQEKIVPKLLSMARAEKDKRIWLIALKGPWSPSNDQVIQEAREGWQTTGAVGCAIIVLKIKKQQQSFSGDDLDLKAALQQFPGNATIERTKFETAVRENKVTRQLLVNAAMAEFNHFSYTLAPGTIIPQPRSDYLREYFSLLEKNN
jgi:tetratricopeptide (TPR) repeat protein